MNFTPDSFNKMFNHYDEVSLFLINLVKGMW